MNTDQKISPQRRGDAECGTKEMAGEAIGHLVWDALASRPSLIGLMEPTTTPADYKGLFLTTAETGMNTDFFNVETRRRRDPALREAQVRPFGNLPTLLRVVCDAFDGFFHGGSGAKQFAEKFASAAFAFWREPDGVDWRVRLGREEAFVVKPLQRQQIKFWINLNTWKTGMIVFEDGQRQNRQGDVIKLVCVGIAILFTGTGWMACDATIPLFCGFDKLKSDRAGVGSARSAFHCGHETVSALQSECFGFTTTVRTREQVGLFHDGRIA